jgi:predicted component of type VI protein secretion system
VVDTLLLPSGLSMPLIDRMRIGRDAGCEVHLDESPVSREHACITRTADGRWYVEDLGSRNGTYVDNVRLAPGARGRLHDGSRLDVANVAIVVALPSAATDPDNTSSLELHGVASEITLSPYQLQVVRHLAAPWLAGAEEPASNAAIAQALGTPVAVDAVKAALRRTYVKVGLAGAPDGAKRKSLCRIARQRGWV